jgi:hypothetical protein
MDAVGVVKGVVHAVFGASWREWTTTESMAQDRPCAGRAGRHQLDDVEFGAFVNAQSVMM